MAALTLSNDVVKDGNGTAVSGGVQTYVDPNRSNAKGAVVAVVLGDGAVLTPGQALAAASIPVVLTAIQAAALAAPVLGAGANLIGSVTVVGATTGGATPYHLVSAATTNAIVVKASAATLKGVQAFNLNASPRYLKLYNKAAAPDENDTPLKVILIPGNSAGGGVIPHFPPEGIAFGIGLAFRLTTGIADNNTGAVAASEILVELDYK